MRELMIIAKKFNLIVLEDAAEALGSFIQEDMLVLLDK